MQYNTKNSLIVTALGALVGGFIGKKLFMDGVKKPQHTARSKTNEPDIIAGTLNGLPSWNPNKRAPVSHMINFMERYLEALRRYHLGVDRLSETGVVMIIKHLKHYEQEIDNGPPNPNPIWGILKEYTPWLTTHEKQLFGAMAYYVTGLAEQKRKELIDDELNYLKKIGALR